MGQSKKPTNAELLARIEALEKKLLELEQVNKDLGQAVVSLAQAVGPAIRNTMVF